jgi:hypothetical protein
MFLEKKHEREILRREKPEANTVRAKADTARGARMSEIFPASEYWYASPCQNVSPDFIVLRHVSPRGLDNLAAAALTHLRL